MKKVSAAKLTPGMIVASDVISYDNRTILSKGTELTATLIARLELYGILTVNVEDKKTEAPAITDPDYNAPEGPSYMEQMRSSERFVEFKEEFDNQISSFSFALSEMVGKNVTADPAELIKGPLDMIKKAGSTGSVLEMLHVMRDYDDSTFAHCMNVSLLNYIVAGWLGWSENEKELAMECGLFFDIGKLKVPHEILEKTDVITPDERDIVQRHAEDGREIIDNHGLDPAIANAALMHHERFDGSGYPFGISGDKIDKYARLVALTDSYDAMTSARPYREAMCPFRAVEIFEDEGLEKYDPDMVLTFLKNVTYTYVQNRCVLSDGRIGTIIMINPLRYSRPVVQVGNKYVDLSKESTLTVEKLI
ncbi:MAG: HD-GYP domain-containing protein [Lachnospiraceae bacterium]|nr:HD-GYP domain-containing protein [Lachnospiraceae bacterium]